MIRNLVASGLLLICISLFVYPSATRSVTANCGHCQPLWIKVLKDYLKDTNLKKDGPLCKYGMKNLFTPCKTEPNQQACPGTGGVVFHCCQTSCLPMLQNCFEGTKIKDNVCIPSNLTNWRPEIVRIHFSDKASRQASGNV